MRTPVDLGSWARRSRARSSRRRARVPYAELWTYGDVAARTRGGPARRERRGRPSPGARSSCSSPAIEWSPPDRVWAPTEGIRTAGPRCCGSKARSERRGRSDLPCENMGRCVACSVFAIALVFVTAVACTKDSSLARRVQHAVLDLLARGGEQRPVHGPSATGPGRGVHQRPNGIQLLTGGSIPLSLMPADGGQPIQGPPTTSPPLARRSPSPSLTSPSNARGVYQLEHVTFPSVGVWTAALSFTAGGAAETLTAEFSVADAPALPRPDKGLRHGEPHDRLPQRQPRGDRLARQGRRDGARPRAAPRHDLRRARRSAVRSSRCSRRPCTA